MQLVEEQEDKFEVDPDWVMPQVTALIPDDGSVEQEVRRLVNTYYDTPGAGLRLFGVTLRRRIGGSDTGWQLKVPNGTTRTEIRSGSRAKNLPPALAQTVAGLLAGESLEPVATVTSTRTAYRILDADGQPVLEIADDLVQSGTPDGESVLHSWREVEAELGSAGKNKDVKQARRLLLGAGASPSAVRTKLDRALGPLSSNGQVPAVKPGTVGELVGAYLAEQCDVIANNDVGLRTGAPVVHKTRVAVRRLRSTLRVFADVIESAPAEELDNELTWYAGVLGEVRDREVLSRLLIERIAELPAEYIRGPVKAEITKSLATERDNAIQQLSEAMGTRRYQHLVRLLRAWKTAPPLTHAALGKSKTAAKYVDEAKRKVDKRLRKAGHDVEELHRARKGAKRLRYAAELMAPADKRMRRTASEAENLQTVLGEHQDAVVAAHFLSRISAVNGQNGQSGFTYGVLVANELNRAADIRASLRN